LAVFATFLKGQARAARVGRRKKLARQPGTSEKEAMSTERSEIPRPAAVLVRHEAEAPRERSTCGWRYRLLSREDAGRGLAAWAHAVDIDGARPHYHRRSTELYYVLEGEGVVVLDGVEHPVRRGSMVHIPPGVVHGARGRMRVLVVGIPDIAEEDLFYPEKGLQGLEAKRPS
jgi:mannose-6-phosphate isomerase-like protein (cupin superfamily)